MSGLEVVVAAVILVGIVGVVVPFLPGTLLVAAALVLWTLDTGGRLAWLVGLAAVAMLAAGAVLKYLLPGRSLSRAGVPRRTLWFGAGLGVVGFFVVPVVGLVLGFVLGVYLAERQRVGDAAWPSTAAAVRAVGLSILIELSAAVLAAAIWAAGVVAT